MPKSGWASGIEKNKTNTNAGTRINTPRPLYGSMKHALINPLNGMMNNKPVKTFNCPRPLKFLYE